MTIILLFAIISINFNSIRRVGMMERIDILKKLEEVEEVDLDGYGSLRYVAERFIKCICKVSQDFPDDINTDILEDINFEDFIVLVLAFQLSIIVEDDIIKDLNLNSKSGYIYGVSDILKKIANREAVIEELKSRIKRIMPDF